MLTSENFLVCSGDLLVSTAGSSVVGEVGAMHFPSFPLHTLCSMLSEGH